MKCQRVGLVLFYRALFKWKPISCDYVQRNSRDMYVCTSGGGKRTTAANFKCVPTATCPLSYKRTVHCLQFHIIVYTSLSRMPIMTIMTVLYRAVARQLKIRR